MARAADGHVIGRPDGGEGIEKGGRERGGKVRGKRVCGKGKG
jgi:hypothetical protein